MDKKQHIKLLLKQSDGFQNSGQLGDEEACLQGALSLDCTNLDAMLRLANLRLARSQCKHAMAIYQYVVKKLPHSSENWLESWSGLVRATYQAGRVEQSEQILRRLTGFGGVINRILIDYFELLFSDEQYSQALVWLERLVKTESEGPELCMMMGKTLHCLRRLDEAEVWFQRSLSLIDSHDGKKGKASLYEEYRWEYAMQLLLTGRFKQGWSFYESRLRAFNYIDSSLQIFPFEHPLWRGEALSNKTLLIHGEQGIGDEIMFMSLVPRLIDQCKHLIIACTPSLATLFERSFPDVTVVAHDRSKRAVSRWKLGEGPNWLSKYKDIDYQCPMGTVPFGLCRTESDFTFNQQPYLFHSERKHVECKSRLEQLIQKPDIRKVGLVWSANLASGKMGRAKSVPLKDLGALCDKSIQFVSLQNYEYGRDFETVPELNIIDLSSALTDFDETAAVISNCDLVISVDTSVAHLSAAMGKPTCMIESIVYGIHQ